MGVATGCVFKEIYRFPHTIIYTIEVEGAEGSLYILYIL